MDADAVVVGAGFFPVVGWAERGDGTSGRARQLGAALPRHRGAPAPGGLRAVRAPAPRRPRWPGGCAMPSGTGSTISCSPAGGSPGPWDAPRAQTVLPRGVASNAGAGGGVRAVRRRDHRGQRRDRRQPRPGAGGWPERLGEAAPADAVLTGVPAHVDGRMLGGSPPGRRRGSSTGTGCGTTSRASATGTRCGRSMPSGSSRGRRRCGSTGPGIGCPRRYFPGFDTLGTLEHLRATGFEHSWFILNRDHRAGVRAVGVGAEPRPDQPLGARRAVGRARGGMPPSVQAFLDHGEDFVDRPPPPASSSPEDERAHPRRAAGPGAGSNGSAASSGTCRWTTTSEKTLQVMPRSGCLAGISGRQADRSGPSPSHRHARPAGAARSSRCACRVLTRKTLGGLQTDLSGGCSAPPVRRCPACMPPARSPASAVAAMHGYRSLEGTFVGGCLFSGRARRSRRRRRHLLTRSRIDQ
jgi:hypothetical protein